MVTEDDLLARDRSQSLQFLSPISQHIVDPGMFSRPGSMAIHDDSRTWESVPPAAAKKFNYVATPFRGS